MKVEEWAREMRAAGHEVSMDATTAIVRLSDAAESSSPLYLIAPPAAQIDTLRVVAAGYVSALTVELPAGACNLDVASLDPRKLTLVRTRERDYESWSPDRVDPTLWIGGGLRYLTLEDVWCVISIPRDRTLSDLKLRGFSKVGAEPGVTLRVRQLTLEEAHARLEGSWHVDEILVYPPFGESDLTPLAWQDGPLTAAANSLEIDTLKADRIMGTVTGDQELSRPAIVRFDGQDSSNLAFNWISPGSILYCPMEVSIGADVAYQHWSFRSFNVRNGLSLGWTFGTADDVWVIHSLRLERVHGLTVHSSVVGLTLDEMGGEVALVELSDGARVLDTRGDAVVALGEGSQLVGAKSRPIAIHGIRSCRQARLDNVDVSTLPLGAFDTLEEASGFTPHNASLRVEPLPRPTDTESGAQMTKRSVRPQRSQLWEHERLLRRVEEALKHLRSPASKVREVQYAHYRARRRTLEFGYEKFLLQAFSVVGYGRRVLRPLFVLGLWIAIVTALGIAMDWSQVDTSTLNNLPLGVWHGAPDQVKAWAMAVPSMFAETLVPFRLVDGSTILSHPGVNTATIALVRSLGAVLIGFAVMGLVRLYRYRED